MHPKETQVSNPCLNKPSSMTPASLFFSKVKFIALTGLILSCKGMLARQKISHFSQSGKFNVSTDIFIMRPFNRSDRMLRKTLLKRIGH